MNKYLHFTHNRMFWIVRNKSDNPIHNLRCPVLTYFLILHPTFWFSQKTYNFLLIVSLTEVLAVALGARLVLVVLPPKRVQLLGNTSEKRVYQFWNIVKRKYHVQWTLFTCTLSCKPASASPPLLPTWARADCWGFILSGALCCEQE